jgi:methylmalonyl-CoA/ethylmalonyl-CoA epimerase
MFHRIDHVALVVADLDEAIGVYREDLQADFYLRGRNEEQGFEVAAFRVGDAHIELLAPTRPDSVLAGFVQKHGPGLHHVALEVQDLDRCLEGIRSRGLQLTSNTPRRGTGDSRIAFVHPKSLFGTMLELVELPKAVGSAKEADPGANIEQYKV